MTAPAPLAERPGILDFSGDYGACAAPPAPETAPGRARLFGTAEELICAVPRALRARRAVVIAPCPRDYWRACERAGIEPDGVLASESREFLPDLEEIGARLSGVDMLLMGNPSNPAGAALPAAEVRGLAEHFPRVTMVVDERFDLSPAQGGTSLLGGALPPNVILLRTAVRMEGLPDKSGVCLIASPDLCRKVEQTRGPQPSGETVSESAVVAVPCDALIAERERLGEALGSLPGLRVFPSHAAFLLLKITKPALTSAQLCERLLARGILARNASSCRGLDARFLRVCVRRPDENDLLLNAMNHALDSAKPKQ